MSLKSDLPPLLGCRVKNVAMLKCFICNVLFDYNVLITLIACYFSHFASNVTQRSSQMPNVTCSGDGSSGGGGESDMLN